MSYRRHIRICNAHDPAAYRPLLVNGLAIGFVGQAFARRLEDFPAVFRGGAAGLDFAEGLDDFHSRTAALADLAVRLSDTGDIRPLDGEPYAAVAAWGDPPAFKVDRALVPPLGLKAFGLHVNGYVPTGPAPSDKKMWIGRRADDRRVAPGKLDNLIGGGQPFGLSLAENLAKEGAEEAGLAAEVVGRAQPAGAVSYVMAQAEGLRRDTLFVFDLVLDDSVRPHNQDGEVAEFRCMPVAEVAARVQETDDFKFNVPLVLIDFFIRHGLLSPEEPGYPELVRDLRR